jgi:hypothetical protein
MCFANVNDITEIMPENYARVLEEVVLLSLPNGSVEKKRYMRIKYI